MDTTVGPRRSRRLNTYDANGRGYLASNLDYTRIELDSWLASPTVLPHLQDWYALCIKDAKRFNDGVEWINTGPSGYYYNENDLEEDLLLMCLCEGNDPFTDGAEGRYSSQNLTTSSCITQELWARAAYRVVQENRGKSQAFHDLAAEHPTAAYAFAIEMLCIIFHSIAHRGSWSVYCGLLKGGGEAPGLQSGNVESEVDGGVKRNTVELAETSSTTSTNATTDIDSDDSTFIEEGQVKEPETPETGMSSRARFDDYDGEEIVVAASVRKWINGVADSMGGGKQGHMSDEGLATAG